jgi:hypothetical protein
MNQGHIIETMNQLTALFSEPELNQLGKDIKFARRNRDITSYRLSMAIITVLASHSIESIADIHRGFNSLFDMDVEYKPFHNQLVKNEFPELMRQILNQLLNGFAMQALSFNGESPFAMFTKILLQDGSSFAINPKLAKVFPGRFTQYNPAAVELHVTLDLLSECSENIVLTAGTASEPQFFPEVEALIDTLIMGDRGYFKKEYIHSVVKQPNVSCIIKGKSKMNPLVKRVILEDGQEIKAWRNQPLKALKHKLRKNSIMDMDVQWKDGKEYFNYRFVVSWNPQGNYFQYLITDLSRETFTVYHIIEAYRLRWQIELMFKEWKSHANLQAFTTEKAPIVEGLIWGSLCAALLKRYIAHVSQKAISTQKVDKCSCYFMMKLMKTLIYRPEKLMAALRSIIKFLADNAKRDSTKQDRINGRCKLGLKPILM